MTSRLNYHPPGQNHFHRIVDVSHELVGDVPCTFVLYRCECGDIYSERLEGTWPEGVVRHGIPARKAADPTTIGSEPMPALAGEGGTTDDTHSDRGRDTDNPADAQGTSGDAAAGRS